ncbi:DUF177 domain-containing protein [Novosphingobium sp. FSY-8]|uniref:DUF177 domain-containing protein n=1 Tax=Novosphingobium ovatum TaxID=1908523 RepID=A0ABW9XFJ4_9SPHN|nr:YceD family protein [Novosphingobium ovatum]NBC37310.1 DUF177 domain-containing protein [Novosphingobium ovatum]
MSNQHAGGEFSHVIDLRHYEDGPLNLTATPQQCKDLARRFDLRVVKHLSVKLTLLREGPVVTATGRMQAAIVQACAISGEDLPVSINEALKLRFVPESTAAIEPDDEIEITETDCDEIPFADNRFDLGEAVAQSLGLAFDPYAEGPEAEAVRASGLLGLENTSPFAALAALKKD